MDSQMLSTRVGNTLTSIAPLLSLIGNPRWAQAQTDPDVSDFVFGNPHEMPLEGFVNTLQHWLTPQNKDWFAYKMNEPRAQAAIAQVLRERRGLPFEAEDIAVTNGAFAGWSQIGGSSTSYSVPVTVGPPALT